MPRNSAVDHPIATMRLKASNEQRVAGCELVLLGERRVRGSALRDGYQGARVLRKRWHDLARQTQGFNALINRPEELPQIQQRPYLVQRELEPDATTPKLAPPPRSAQER